MMRSILTRAALIALVSAPLCVFAADETKVLTGEPVDISCYLGGKSGAAHASCAVACAEKGLPIGLLVGEGETKQLYLVLGGGGKSATDLMVAHMGKQVEVTGTVTKMNGLMVLTASKVKMKDQASAAWKPKLIFYSLPLTVCPVCRSIDTWVADLTSEYDGKVAFEQKSSTDSAVKAEMAARNVDGHGIVILDAEGKVAWVSEGHNLTKEAVAEGLKAVASE